jgi:hypothetical protein
MQDFYGTSSENPVEEWSQILWNELERIERFLGLNRHFTAMLTITLLVAIIGVTSRFSDATNFFF